MITEKEFIEFVRRGIEFEKVNAFIEGNSKDDVIKILRNIGSYKYVKELLKRLVDDTSERVSKDLLLNLLKGYLYQVDSNTPDYIFSDKECAEVIINKNVKNIEYFKDNHLTNEIIELVISKRYDFIQNSQLVDSPIIHNKYYILRVHESQREAFKLILNELDTNPSFFSIEELEKIIDISVVKYNFRYDALFEIANYHFDLYFRLLKLDVNKFVFNIDKIKEEHLTDEANGLVYALIDYGYRLDSKTPECIKTNENYMNYMVDKEIETDRKFYFLSRCSDNIIDNPDNGIIIKAIRNGWIPSDIIYNYPVYILERINYVSNISSVLDILKKCPKEILEEPSNGVVLGAISIDKKGDVIGPVVEIIGLRKEYVLAYMKKNGKESLDYLINKLPSIDKETFIEALKNGYELSNYTPSYIKTNEEWMALASKEDKDCIRYIDPQVFLNESNGILLNALSMGLKYNEEFDDILFSKKSYVKGFIQSSETWQYDRILSRTTDEILTDESLYYLAINNGYRYTEKSHPNFLKPKLIIYYIKRCEYPSGYEHLPDILSEELLLDHTNGIVMTMIDQGYNFWLKAPPMLLENEEYLKYFVRNNPNEVIYLFKMGNDINKFNIYSLLNLGYEISSCSPKQIKDNRDYIMYAADTRKLKESRVIDFEMDEELVRTLIINKVPVKHELISKYNLELLCLGTKTYISYYPKEEEKEIYNYIKEYVKVDRLKDLANFPLEHRNDYDYILYGIYSNANVIDLMDEEYLTEELISLALKERYIIKDKDRFNNYIVRLGINKVLLYYPDLIDYYSEEDFNKLNLDYKAVIDIAFDYGYNYKKNITSLPDTLDNPIFINKAIENNFTDVFSFVTFNVSKELFIKSINRDVKLYNLSDSLKRQIVNRDELFYEVFNLNNVNKLLEMIEVFISTGNLTHPKLDIVINSLSEQIEIKDKYKFINKIKYLYSKNKELFIGLNPDILSDQYDFLGVETLNRIIPDSNIVKNVLKINNKHKLILFNLCINYLYSINLDINVNDIVYKIVKNLSDGKFNLISTNIVKEWKNIDVLVKLLQDDVFKGKRLDKLDNLVATILLPTNYYGIEHSKTLDSKLYLEKRKNYFDNLVLTDDITILKKNILLKYYNIDYDSAYFIYERYCYLLDEIDSITDINLRCILHDIKFLFECSDINSLMEIYNNIDIQSVSFDYVIQLEGLLRNEYVRAYDEVLLKNPKKKIKDNIYEIEENINMFVHVLGGYHRSTYTEPTNFKEAWNIELMTNHGICTSYLNDQNLTTAPRSYPTLGFASLEPNSILLAEPDDIVSNGYNIRYATALQKACKFLFPKKMTDETRYHHNEIVLERKKLDAKEGQDYKRQPDFIIYIAEGDCILENNELNMDYIEGTNLWRMTQKAANNFNVPILIINKAKVTKKEHDEINKLRDELSNSKNWSLINDIIVRYINNLMGENKYFDKQELFDFVDGCLKLSDSLELNDSKTILEVLLYTINEENRKFKDHKGEEEYNYLSKYEEVVLKKLNDLNEVVITKTN